YGVAQLEEFVKRQGWAGEQVLVVDAHYTGEPFLNPVHQLGIPILGRVANNRVFFLPPPPSPGFGRPRVRGRKLKLNDARTLPKRNGSLNMADGSRSAVGTMYGCESGPGNGLRSLA